MYVVVYFSIFLILNNVFVDLECLSIPPLVQLHENIHQINV